MEALIADIERRCKLSDKEREVLMQNTRKLHFPKDSVVVDYGKVDDSMYFIRKGIWRAYVDRNGEQVTLWFGVPGECIFSSWGYIKGTPSRISIVASSDSVAIELKKRTIVELTNTLPGFDLWLNETIMEMILTVDNSLVDISSPNAEKRYLALMKKMPAIFKEVPLKEIAGYIGVTPQSLSRIRARLRSSSSSSTM
ncbi:Crp/Fnr family transcriptional regulator [Bacteroides sp. OttesenSCG-928-F21]|nr:Crp/Fnr family transcriptional regulator [Bacteroides sp. OttesenSCG-928-F21]